MPNQRIYYAVHAIGFAKIGTNTFTTAHGVQSVGINTKFNLEQVFELGQVAIYENIENIPDIEITSEKVLDGYPPLYCLATNGSTSASLSGRSNQKTIVGLSIYGDTQDSASGTPIAQCTMSGVYCSSLAYNFQVQGNSTEQVTLVGNNKVWNNTFTGPAFTNLDSPLAITGSGGVNRREDVIFYPLSAGGKYTHLPQDIPNISASGTNNQNTDGTYKAHLQSIKISSNLGREQLFELGRRGPYHRYITFPVEVKCDIEVIDITGDQVTALEDAASNLTDRTINVYTREGLYVDLGTKNKLNSVTYSGGNAGQQGGNVQTTYSYTTFNDLTITHPQDPSGL